LYNRPGNFICSGNEEKESEPIDPGYLGRVERFRIGGTAFDPPNRSIA
jgi:hypothetical protein